MPSSSRLSLSLLGFVVAVVAVITLEPFAFAAPSLGHVVLHDTPVGMVANVALFLPLGFLHALTWRRVGMGDGEAVLRALAAGALLSAGIEVVQLFEPVRYPSPVDVAMNTGGAAIGAWLHALARRRLGSAPQVAERLALRLPVVGLLYVALPLATLAATTLADPQGTGLRMPGTPGLLAMPRGLGLLALGALGGTLLGVVQQRRLGPAGVRRGATVLAGAGWAAVATVPALATAPVVFGATVAVAALTAWVHGRAGAPELQDRRFEGAALRRAAPLLVFYLLLLPLGDPTVPTPPGVEPPQLVILRRLEWPVAFAVLGYVLAAAWGRRELRWGEAAWRVAAAAGASALALVAVAVGSGHVPAGPAATVVRVLAALHGGWIYHCQRAYVQSLAAGAERPAAAPVVARAA